MTEFSMLEMGRSSKMKRGQLITSDQAKPVRKQHTSPCTDCPWARSALPGWLGGVTAPEWIAVAQGEILEPCHALFNTNGGNFECAGLAIFRANICKKVRTPGTLDLAPDRVKVFSSPKEFLEHHGSGVKEYQKFLERLHE